jgi:hypothetical protein
MCTVPCRAGSARSPDRRWIDAGRYALADLRANTGGEDGAGSSSLGCPDNQGAIAKSESKRYSARANADLAAVEVFGKHRVVVNVREDPAVAANLANPADPGLKKAIARVKRAFGSKW